VQGLLAVFHRQRALSIFLAFRERGFHNLEVQFDQLLDAFKCFGRQAEQCVEVGFLGCGELLRGQQSHGLRSWVAVCLCGPHWVGGETHWMNRLPGLRCIVHRSNGSHFRMAATNVKCFFVRRTILKKC
jgi:hypothetical protein